MSRRISILDSLGRALSAPTLAAGVLAAAVVMAPPAVSAQQNLGRNDTSWHWDGQVGSGQWLRVFNVNGPVSVTASADGNVHVRAEKRARDGGDPRAVHFDVARDDRGLSVCALWTDDATCDASGAHNNSIHTDGSDRRQKVEVTFAVQVPAGVRASMNTVNGALSITRVASEVNARTVNGAVRVRDAGATVDAHTVNGDVSVNTRGGPVSAETVNGSIDATMASQGTASMHFRTVNGGIDIDAPDALDADVELSTVNGSVESSYALNYDRRRRHAEGTVGHGGPSLVASTVNGSVALH